MIFFYSLKKDNYEDLLHNLVKSATVVDHSRSPCDPNFVPEIQPVSRENTDISTNT